MVVFCLSRVRWLAEFLRQHDRGEMGRGRWGGGLQTSLQCFRKENPLKRRENPASRSATAWPPRLNVWMPSFKSVARERKTSRSRIKASAGLFLLRCYLISLPGDATSFLLKAHGSCNGAWWKVMGCWRVGRFGGSGVAKQALWQPTCQQVLSLIGKRGPRDRCGAPSLLSVCYSLLLLLMSIWSRQAVVGAISFLVWKEKKGRAKEACKRGSVTCSQHQRWVAKQRTAMDGFLFRLSQCQSPPSGSVCPLMKHIHLHRVLSWLSNSLYSIVN